MRILTVKILDKAEITGTTPLLDEPASKSTVIIHIST